MLSIGLVQVLVSEELCDKIHSSVICKNVIAR